MIYFLDTNICVYALNRRRIEVLEKLRSVSRSAIAERVPDLRTENWVS